MTKIEHIDIQCINNKNMDEVFTIAMKSNGIKRYFIISTMGSLIGYLRCLDDLELLKDTQINLLYDTYRYFNLDFEMIESEIDYKLNINIVKYF